MSVENRFEWSTCCANTISGGIGGVLSGMLSGVSVSAFDDDTLSETSVDLLVGCGIGLVVGGAWEGGKTCLLAKKCCRETGDKLSETEKKCCSVWGKQILIGGLTGVVDSIIEITSEGKSSIELIKDFGVGCAAGAFLGGKTFMDEMWGLKMEQAPDVNIRAPQGNVAIQVERQGLQQPLLDNN